MLTYHLQERIRADYFCRLAVLGKVQVYPEKDVENLLHIHDIQTCMNSKGENSIKILIDLAGLYNKG